MSGFSFQEEVVLTEEDYVLLHGFAAPLNWIKLGLLVGLAAALLVFPATRWLGTILLVVGLVVLAMSRSMPWVARWQWRKERPHLQSAVTCGLSDTEIWTRGAGFEARFGWPHVSGWRLGAGWLWIGSRLGGIAYFRTDSLHQAGIYEAVLERARGSAIEGDPIRSA